jgi:hypothetical protein
MPAWLVHARKGLTVLLVRRNNSYTIRADIVSGDQARTSASFAVSATAVETETAAVVTVAFKDGCTSYGLVDFSHSCKEIGCDLKTKQSVWKLQF